MTQVEINFTHTPNVLNTEKKSYRLPTEEVFKLVKDTLSTLKKNTNLYRKVHGEDLVGGHMTLIQSKSLAGRPQVKVIFPVIRFPKGSDRSETLWQAEIIVDDRDWLYETGKNFVVSMKNRYSKIDSYNQYRV